MWSELSEVDRGAGRGRRPVLRSYFVDWYIPDGNGFYWLVKWYWSEVSRSEVDRSWGRGRRPMLEDCAEFTVCSSDHEFQSISDVVIVCVCVCPVFKRSLGFCKLTANRNIPPQLRPCGNKQRWDILLQSTIGLNTKTRTLEMGLMQAMRLRLLKFDLRTSIAEESRRPTDTPKPNRNAEV